MQMSARPPARGGGGVAGTHLGAADKVVDKSPSLPYAFEKSHIAVLSRVVEGKAL